MSLSRTKSVLAEYSWSLWLNSVWSSFRYQLDRHTAFISDEDKQTRKSYLAETFARNIDDDERHHIRTCNYYRDQKTFGLRVEAMVDSVRLFAHGKGLRKYNRQRKRTLLPHLEGTDVQNNFLTLPNTGNAKDYRKGVATFNAYFVQKSAPRTLGTVSVSKYKHQGKQFDSLRSDVDKCRKISTTARARKIKFSMKSFADAAVPVTVGGL